MQRRVATNWIFPQNGENQNVYKQSGKNVIFGDFYGKTVSQVKNMPIFRFLEKNSRFWESFTKKKKKKNFGNFSLYLATWMKSKFWAEKCGWRFFFLVGNPDAATPWKLVDG